MRVSDITREWIDDNLHGVEWNGNSAMAWCPCHDDEGTTHKGLSITFIGDKCLMKCQSGHCGATATDVIRQCGEEYDSAEDFVVNVKSHRNGDSPDLDLPDAATWWVAKTQIPWEVWDALGVVAEKKELHFTFNGFDLYKYRAAGTKEFGWSERGDNKPPLWPVPEDELPEQIGITEGESDCGTARHLGYHAFGITKGAGQGEKRYLKTYEFEALRERGAQAVILFGDMDESGLEMLDRTSKSAVDAGLTVDKVHLERVLDPFSGMNDLNAIWHELLNKKKCIEKIKRATQRVSTKYHAYDVSEMLVLAEQEMVWSVPELLMPGDKVMISGPQKSLKTYLSLDLARSLVTCKPFMARPQWTPKQTLRCHFIQEEGSLSAWSRRIKRMQMPTGAQFSTWHKAGIRFTDAASIDETISFCRENHVDVVFFDPLQRMIPGVDENDASAMGVIWDEVARLQMACPNLVVIIVHHSNKVDRLSWESGRGSNRSAGEVDLGIFMMKDSQTERKLQIWFEGRDISSDLAPGQSFGATYSVDDDLFTLDAEEKIVANVHPIKKMALQTSDSVQIAVLDGCKTRESIISQTGLSEATVRTHLKKLVEGGKIVEEDNGPGNAKTYKERTA